MGLLAELIDLVLPSSCICCQRSGPLWCAACRPASIPELAATATGPAICAAGEYDAELRSALIAYKERGHRALAEPLSAYLGDAVDVLSRQVGTAAPGRPRPVLVPVPSRRSAARQRGGDHVLRLARLVARHSQLPLCSALSVSSGVADSAGLSTAARAANLAHRMRAARPPGRGPLGAVIVDDIVTTGTTLAEAERALTEAGWQVLGAAVVGATRRRYPTAAAGASGASDGARKQSAAAGTDASNWADAHEWASV